MTPNDAGDTALKVLGLRWDAGNDSFSFDPTDILCMAGSLRTMPTKRDIIRISFKIFDPIGFLAPVVLHIKMLYQLIWSKKID